MPGNGDEGSVLNGNSSCSSEVTWNYRVNYHIIGYEARAQKISIISHDMWVRGGNCGK